MDSTKSKVNEEDAFGKILPEYSPYNPVSGYENETDRKIRLQKLMANAENFAVA